MTSEAFKKAIDDLNENSFEEAIADFLAEQGKIEQFLVWLKKWKANHTLIRA